MQSCHLEVTQALIRRIHLEAPDVVQSCHLEVTQALPRRDFEKYVEEELVQHSLAAPFVDEARLRAMILRFDAVVRLVDLEMEQVFCKNMIYIYIHTYIMLCGPERHLFELFKLYVTQCVVYCSKFADYLFFVFDYLRLLETRIISN